MLRVDLAVTPRFAPPGENEDDLVRRTATQHIKPEAAAVVLVDIWNLGWPDGPKHPETGELFYHYSLSHELRKQAIVRERIAPLVQAARAAGVLVIHANEFLVLRKYPQWEASTTPEERAEVERQICEVRARRRAVQQGSAQTPEQDAAAGSDTEWPPSDWVERWRRQRGALLGDHSQWLKKWSRWTERRWAEVHIPNAVAPQDGDLLAFDTDQLHRLLTQRRIRVLFFAGFEVDHCLIRKPYGMRPLSKLGYLCAVVRDATTTMETAASVRGLLHTSCAVEDIEWKIGYSLTTEQLLAAL